MLEYVTESRISGGLVLDLGTKDGRKTSQLDACVVGVDINFERRQSNDITFIAGDARELPFPNDTFDVVIADQLLEHVHSTDAVVAEVARVLKPDGQAYIAFPHRFMPTKPHELPRWFSLLPAAGRQWVGSQVISAEEEEYSKYSNSPLSPWGARKVFEKHFEDVDHGTLSFRRECADRYTREGGPAANFFEHVRPAIEMVTTTSLGRFLFENFWPHPEYVLQTPK